VGDPELEPDVGPLCEDEEVEVEEDDGDAESPPAPLSPPEPLLVEGPGADDCVDAVPPPPSLPVVLPSSPHASRTVAAKRPQSPTRGVEEIIGPRA